MRLEKNQQGSMIDEKTTTPNFGWGLFCNLNLQCQSMRVLIVGFLFAFIHGSAQTRYLAVYESKVHFDFSNISFTPNKNIKFTIDSSKTGQTDSLFKEFMDTGFQKLMFQQIMGDSAIVYIRVESDATHGTLESYGGGRINIHMSGDNMIYKNSDWEIYNPDKKIYERQDSTLIEEFRYTGRTKKILGYDCSEAVTKDSLSKTIVWVCKDLTQSISPGITTKNLDCAIFEYLNPKQKIDIRIKSFKKYRLD